MCRFWAYDESKKLLGAGKDAPAWKLAAAGSMAGGIAGLVGNPGGASSVCLPVLTPPSPSWLYSEIVMVRLQGDFAKPPEKRFNYKHCFDALFRMVREEGVSSLARGAGPNVFRAILMNASQLASYDFFKAELLKTKYFEDNILCHFTASFAAVRPSLDLNRRLFQQSTLGVIRTSLKNEGAVFMFKGWVPAWTRLQPTTILIFLTLEQLKNLVDFSRSKGVMLF
ncbi:hypothetical protein DXG03_000031 [Asterophora parasitica]|uniref:Uncharacterized protein n=1 Tax=Asterophora parasitica TaxID=117018 RepID=A0A9P7GJY5_9AGAR|nr:hypothetical protein DXG03_000031 [Asterophora parasitica]